MPEKKSYDLTVDPEFRDLIPPLNEEELKLLEESLVADGCESPLIVWNGVIIDGHNRYAICRKHDIPFSIQEKHFDTREDVMLWMLRNQLGRRNLNSYQRSELALRTEPLLREAAKKKQATSTGGQEPQLLETSRKAEKKLHTDKELASLAGVSDNTIRKARRIDRDADDAVKRELRQGKLTVNKAYTNLVEKARADETRICDRGEKEVGTTASITSETATSNPAEPYSIPGMVMHNGAPIHVETALPDTPEMFCYVADLVKSCCDSYVIGLTSAMRRYSSGMGSEEHDAQILELVRQTNAQVLTILNERMKEK